MLSRWVITFLPWSKRLWISWLQSPSTVILEPPKIKSVTVSTVSPSICHEVMGPDALILVFWMLSFKPTFWLSSFSFIKRLFISSSLSTKRVVSSAYLRFLIFLPAILIPSCASSSPVFLMMYSAYKLNGVAKSRIWLSNFHFSIKFKSFYSTKETKPGEKTTLRIGENNSKGNNWQRIKFQNLQAAHTTQYQKSK